MVEVDRILACRDYNLRSWSRLSARDDVHTRAWLEGFDPLFTVYLRLRNRRITSRKEFYETAFVLDRLSDILAETTSLYEMGAGHGMLGTFACILHPGLRRVVHVDRRRAACYDRVLESSAKVFPYVKRRVRFKNASLHSLASLKPGALVLGVHCCGALTDRVAEAARAVHSPFVVMPCCESRSLLMHHGEKDSLRGEDIADAVNVQRVERWRQWGYRVEERRVPERVTARNRLFVATLDQRVASPCLSETPGANAAASVLLGHARHGSDRRAF